MLQLLLMLLGLTSPDHQLKSIRINQTQINVPLTSNFEGDLDTGGETGTTLPPKK